jgi:hypothetical protein
MKKNQQLLSIRHLICLLLLSTFIISCNFQNKKESNKCTVDSTKLLLIKQTLAKKELLFEDYETLFSGTDPLVNIAMDDFLKTPNSVNAIRMLAIEKLYNQVIGMSNAAEDSELDRINLSKVSHWPIVMIDSELHKKWLNCIKKAQNINK